MRYRINAFVVLRYIHRDALLGSVKNAVPRDPSGYSSGWAISTRLFLSVRQPGPEVSYESPYRLAPCVSPIQISP